MIIITKEDFHLNHTAIALGKFEGLHLGHQCLIDEIVRQKKYDYKSVVFTFDRPPAQVLTGEKNTTQIFTKKERSDILEKKGIDILIEHPFTREFASMNPVDFIRRILVGRLGACRLVVGRDFRFGAGRAGTVDTLQYMAQDCDYDLIVMDKLKKDGQDISSTRVRKALDQADLREVCALLGRPYSIFGKVVHGRKIGSGIGVPTINLALEEGKCTPPDGVYITSARLEDRTVCGVTNIGIRPTVDQSRVRNVETHFLDFDQDLYGREICLSFHEYVRPEIKFDSLEGLKDQLSRDIAYARSLSGRKEHL